MRIPAPPAFVWHLVFGAWSMALAIEGVYWLGIWMESWVAMP